MINIDRVTKNYPTKQSVVKAVDNISLEIKEGEFFVITGPSGSGKTTLLMLIGCMLSPSQGSIIYDTLRIETLRQPAKAKFRADNIGFVFQMFYLIPYLTVLDNVLLADIRGNRRKKQASALLEKFGLSQRLRHYPVQLSAGEQQRVAMARALLNNPRVILADEPTGNLDPENAAEVVNHLIEFNKNGGTVLLATHQQSRFIDNARQISLKAGRLI